jgi:predicted esterase
MPAPDGTAGRVVLARKRGPALVILALVATVEISRGHDVSAAGADAPGSTRSPASPAPSPTGPPAPVPLAVTAADFDARTFRDAGGHALPYRLFVPRGLSPSRKVPLVLFLHGSGGRGDDNLHQLTDQAAPLVFVQPDNQARWPVFMVAPQCPAGEQWVAMPWGAPSGKGHRPAEPTWPMAAALALVDQLATEFPAIDATQLYVTGMSMGGYGTFDAAARAPHRWRAAVPICGGYDETQVAPLVGVPLWAFHAEDDPVVPVARTRDVIAALRRLGGHPRYTEYPASARHGHLSWIPAYADPALLPWMFGPHPTPDAAAVPGAPPTSTAPPPPSAPPVVPARQRGCACAVAHGDALSARDQAAGRNAALASAIALVLGLVTRRRRRAEES